MWEGVGGEGAGYELGVRREDRFGGGRSIGVGGGGVFVVFVAIVVVEFVGVLGLDGEVLGVGVFSLEDWLVGYEAGLCSGFIV